MAGSVRLGLGASPCFRILGPVEVWADDRRVALGGGHQLKLLAFLLLGANRAMSSDALIDSVWGPERDGASKRLQMAVARLRRALEPLATGDESVLRTVSGGYLLSVAPGELDADVFADRVQEGRAALRDDDPARASVLLADALRLWRGPPLAEMAFEDFAASEIRRLQELRLVTLETRSTLTSTSAVTPTWFLNSRRFSPSSRVGIGFSAAPVTRGGRCLLLWCRGRLAAAMAPLVRRQAVAPSRVHRRRAGTAGRARVRAREGARSPRCRRGRGSIPAGA